MSLTAFPRSLGGAIAGGRVLGNARKNKNDEFYTQRKDIEDELRHYKWFFEGKVVFCNCDDPFESEFFKYFALNFNHLKLKKLICTSYTGSPISHTEFNDLPLFHKDEKMPYMIEIIEVGDYNKDGKEDLGDIEWLLRNNKNTLTILDGDGDFRSEECIGFLEEADVVVTNPPFSLFREYISQLMKYKKKFLIIGNNNAVTYKEVFPLIKENKIWLGYNVNKTFEFRLSKDYEKWSRIENGVKFGNVPAISWYTNIDTEKRHDEIILFKKYNSLDYPTYDNYDAINVDRVADIPEDYYGKMGVPITFLNNYNPDQFEIIGFGAGDLGVEAGVRPYNREYKKLSSALRDGIPFIYNKKTNTVKVPYARIIIRRRKNEN